MVFPWNLKYVSSDESEAEVSEGQSIAVINQQLLKASGEITDSKEVPLKLSVALWRATV
jgi:hypothetical protein